MITTGDRRACDGATRWGRSPLRRNEGFAMDVSVDTKSDLVTGVADVRYKPLSRLAQEAGGADSLRRVLPESGARRDAVAAFNSSI